MDTLRQDLRFALRTFVRTPGLSIALVLTFALGVGATTAIFTVVDRVVLRPLPFPGSERVVVMCETNPRLAGVCVASPSNVADWARSVPALESAGVMRDESVVAQIDGGSLGVHGGLATAGLFRALDMRPALGRLFDDHDVDSGANHVVILSDAFWRERFGASTDVVGRDLMLDGRAMRIIGVLPERAYIPIRDGIEVWLPITAGIDDATKRSWRGFTALGRIAAGRTRKDVDAELDVVRGRLAAEYPASNAGWACEQKACAITSPAQ